MNRGFASSASDSAHGAHPSTSNSEKFGENSFPKMESAPLTTGYLHSHERIRYSETESDLLERDDVASQWSIKIANKDNLRAKLKVMQSDGPAHLMIMADFD